MWKSDDARSLAGRTKHSLREEEEYFRHSANFAPTTLWTTGPDKLCDFVNQRWLAFTGRKLEQELGLGWAECVHPEDLHHCLDIYHTACDARRPFEMEYRARRYDGEYRWLLDSGMPRFDFDD